MTSNSTILFNILYMIMLIFLIIIVLIVYKRIHKTITYTVKDESIHIFVRADSFINVNDLEYDNIYINLSVPNTALSIECDRKIKNFLI